MEIITGNYYRKLLQEIISENYLRKLSDSIYNPQNYHRKLSASISSRKNVGIIGILAYQKIYIKFNANYNNI